MKNRTLRQEFDYTNKDFTAFREMMIGYLREKMPEYTDLSDSDAGIVILEACAMGLDILSYYNDVAANEAFFTTLRQRTNALKWCRIFGYNPRPAIPARYMQVFKLSHPRAEDTIIPVGTVVKAMDGNYEIFFETVETLVIPAGKIGDEKVGDNYTYAVEIVHGLSVIQEVVGSSTGAPSQSFKLYYHPVIEDSVHVYVGSGTEITMWKRVPTFMDSSPTDRHFTVQYTGSGETVIMFGDGAFGAIPGVGMNNVVCSYRAGGGTEGNLGPYTIQDIVSPIPFVETFNPYLPEVYGADHESLESIKMKAPNTMRTLWGALTLKDFSDIVIANFPEVSSAICVESTIDSLRIFLIMKEGETLTNEYKTSIQDFFAENKGGRKIVGVTDIELLPPNEVTINLTANLIVDTFYEADTVKDLIEDFVKEYFKKEAEQFTEYISLNQLMRDVLSVSVSDIEGIRSFAFQAASVAGGTPSSDFSISPDIINLGKGEIVKLNAITINTL